VGTLLNPLYILSLVLAGIGFVIFQWSLKDYKYASHTTAVSGTLAIVVPIAAGILFLNEILTLPQLVGVAMITAVAAFLMLKRG
jgi:drug/metabolite transporter (DMT)-like permease